MRLYYDFIHTIKRVIVNARGRLATINFSWTGSMMRFLECKKTSQPSMMRLGFLVSMIVGSIVGLCGCVAMLMSLPDAGTAITIGLGLIGSSGFAKAVQAKYESATN